MNDIIDQGNGYYEKWHKHNSGKLYRRTFKKVYGVGINDADYTIKPTIENNRSKCMYYEKWIKMLQRCYSKSYQEKHPSYKGCSVCEEWLIFSNFKSWMEQQEWEGKHLDKDLLVYKNKIYSPETCCFVTQTVNSFLVLREADRGKYPIGVHYRKRCSDMVNDFSKPFGATIGNHNRYIGVFSSKEEAHSAWQKAKIEQAKQLQSEQTDLKVVLELQRIIDMLQYEYDNNLETKYF